jgi:hypothetical protein
MNVRRGACEAQALAQKTQAPFPIVFWGQGLATRRVLLESLWAWIESQQSMPCVFPYGRNLVTMGHVRRKPKLLPNKLVLIREHLGIVLVDMARNSKLDQVAFQITKTATANRL